ncbi:MAG: amino acid permease [Nanoarchaeota archaeon]|nr:amino acid permease [Nanoarchaeota archaeon]
MVRLRRELNLWQVTVAGVGIILGAGIYALIGVAAGGAGNAIWLAFLISAIVAAFTGLSYAELTSMFKGDAAEYDYFRKAFNSKIAFIFSIIILAAGVVSAATVSLGFAGYLIKIFNVPLIIGAIGLILLMTIINFTGIKESARFNTLSTFIEFGGLILVIILGIKSFGSVNYLEMPQGLSGVFSTAALVFFAYMGFESIVKLREETKNPDRNIPLALIYSIIITTILYVVVSVAAVSIIKWQDLHASSAPLASVVATSIGPVAFIIIGIVALFSTANTVLITLVTNSRMIYGMAREKSLPEVLAKVHKKTRTPWVAIFLIAFVACLFVFAGDIELVANLTNLFLFAVFGMINLSMMVLRYKIKTKRKFLCPLNIGRFSVVGLLGIISSLVMFVFVVLNLIGMQTIF